jgi:peptide/nickel transport system ATP-binding protein
MTLAFPAPVAPLLEVSGLRVGFGRNAPVVNDVSFTIAAGECLALVGESGSGKSVTARSLIGLAGGGAVTHADRLAFDGEDLRQASAGSWRRLRGGPIGFVLQDALGSLDPLRQVGAEIAEPLRIHTRLSRRARAAEAIELLRRAGVPEPELRVLQLPGQLSGGLRQRALIASAIACGPKLLIADEPTTALDAAVQAQILALLDDLRRHGTALLLISHDLGVVANLADRIAVMRGGRILEEGTSDAILRAPRHEYTRRLVAAAEVIHGGKSPHRTVTRLPSAVPLVRIEGVSKSYDMPRQPRRAAVQDVSLLIHAGETIGLVGASGSGKTTVARLLLGLARADEGRILVGDRDWTAMPERDRRTERRRMQVVFQDPLSSFDPRYTVARVLDEAIGAGRDAGIADRRGRAAELLRQVTLSSDLLDRRPIELSGGQRQRVAIARALAPGPELLVCDEPVSALDVSVQAEILALLDDLKTRLGLACLFISHDLGVVRRISDRVAVMRDGYIVEEGTAEQVFTAPRHAYTRELLAAIPPLQPTVRNAHA